MSNTQGATVSLLQLLGFTHDSTRNRKGGLKVERTTDKTWRRRGLLTLFETMHQMRHAGSHGSSNPGATAKLTWSDLPMILWCSSRTYAMPDGLRGPCRDAWRSSPVESQVYLVTKNPNPVTAKTDRLASLTRGHAERSSQVGSCVYVKLYIMQLSKLGSLPPTK